jgi:hypothetical protein
VTNTTQVTIDEGRPDIEIWTPQPLLYVEVKVESLVDLEQIQRYLEELRPKEGRLILLTRRPPGKLGDDKKDVRKVRWYEVAAWLKQLRLDNCSSTGYLVEQFVDFLRARNMSIDKVRPELTEGVRSLYNLLKMVREVLIQLGHAPSTFTLNLSEGIIGASVDNQRFWVGLGINEPQILAVNTMFHVDKNKVDQRGLSAGLIKKVSIAIPGDYQWRQVLNLEDGKPAFLDRTENEQMAHLEEFFLKVFNEAAQIEN